MSKFDRGVFIFIGLGIWALAMTQVFEPGKTKAATFFTQHQEPTRMIAKCPEWFLASYHYNESNEMIRESMFNKDSCHYLLVVTYDDLVIHKKLFNLYADCFHSSVSLSS